MLGTLGVLVSLVPGLAAPAVPHLAAAVVGITTGRAQSLMALMVGLLSAVIGRLALAGSAGGRGTGARRGRALLALGVGLIGMLASGLLLANTTGIGTGSGRLGAIVALAMGLCGTVLGGLALVRARRAN